MKKIIIFTAVLVALISFFKVSFVDASDSEKMGSIKVCFIFVDKNDKIIRDFSNSNVKHTDFNIPLTVHEDDKERVIENAIVDTRTFSTNKQIIKTDDAWCTKFTLPIKDYYYKKEKVTGSGADQWVTALYNDEYNTEVKSLDDFYSIVTEDNADKIIVLHDDRPNRRLVVLNRLKEEFKKQEPVGCIAIKNNVFDYQGQPISPVPAFSFKIDGGASVSTNSNGSATVQNVSVGNHTVTQVAKNGWTTTSVTPTNGAVSVGAGTQCAEVTFNNKQNDLPDIVASCSANPSTAYIGDSIVYTASATGGTGAFTYSWNGDGGLSGTAQTAQISYNATGTKSAHVTINSGNKSVTKNCTATIVDRDEQVLNGSCSANPGTAKIGETITYSASVTGAGTSTPVFSWSGDDNLSGTTQSIQKTYSTVGNKNAIVNISAGGQSISRSCSSSISSSTIQFELTCSPNVSSATVGDTITFTASASGGNGSYQFSWSGDDSLSGTATTTSHTYDSSGTKNATITATSSNEVLTAQCSLSVSSSPVVPPITPPSGGGGGGTSWGYLISSVPVSTTTVSVVNEVASATPQVAGVFLSQVPYTGIGDVFKVTMFISGLFGWSVLMAFLIVRKKFGSLVVVGAGDSSRIEDKLDYESDSRLDVLRTSDDDLAEILENHAREQRVILSASALEIIINKSAMQKHTALSILDSAISECVKGRDENELDWTILNVDKIDITL